MQIVAILAKKTRRRVVLALAASRKTWQTIAAGQEKPILAGSAANGILASAAGVSAVRALLILHEVSSIALHASFNILTRFAAVAAMHA